MFMPVIRNITERNFETSLTSLTWSVYTSGKYAENKSQHYNYIIAINKLQIVLA